jgi:hypothetical protein
LVPSPRPWSRQEKPFTGWSGGICFASLGGPVEADGSVYWKGQQSLFFQLLDEKGMAVQTMRSLTMFIGEQLSCVGCHEQMGGAIASAVPWPRRPPPP